jgi:hypothetical protein
MRLLSGYLLLGLYLLCATPMVEIVRVPHLFQHFNQHKIQDVGMGWKGFLHMHYAHAQDKDADESQDRQLPFANPQFTISHDMVFLPAQQLAVKAGYHSKIEHNTPYFFVFQHHTSSMWHPPTII